MRRRGGNVWTPEDDDIVRSSAKANHSIIRVAGRLSRTIASVQRRAGELGAKLKGIRKVKAEARSVLFEKRE